MHRIFFSNLLFSLLLNLLIKPIAIFGIDAQVQNAVGLDQYGLYFSLLSLSLILNILMDLGINNYVIQTVAKNKEEAKSQISSILVLRLALFLVYISILFISAFLLGYDSTGMKLLFFLGLNQLLIVFIAYFRGFFSGLQHYKLDSFFSVFDRILLIITAGTVLLLPTKYHMSIHLYIQLQTVGYFLTFLMSFIFFKRMIGTIHWKIDLHHFKAVLQKSLPFAILIILMSLYTRIDGILLHTFATNGNMEAGVYAKGFRLLDALYMFGMIFAGLLFPMFSNLLHESLQKVRELVLISSHFLMSGVIVVVFILIEHAGPILQLIYTSPTEAIAPFSWLMLSFLGIAMNFVFGTLLTANGNLKELNIISAIGVLLNVSLNIILIPKYGAAGAGFTAFITQITMAITQFILCARYFQLTIGFVSIGKWLLFTLCFASVLFVINFILMNLMDQNFLNDSPILFGLILCIEFILGLTLMFIFKFIEIKPLKNLFLSRS
ncbi:MAG: oligosaccharide flippase family protein [Flavobacteriales bacterium]